MVIPSKGDAWEGAEKCTCPDFILHTLLGIILPIRRLDRKLKPEKLR